MGLGLGDRGTERGESVNLVGEGSYGGNRGKREEQVLEGKKHEGGWRGGNWLSLEGTRITGEPDFGLEAFFHF